MDRAEIRIFMSRLGISKISESERKVRGTCPLARWYHSGGVDKTPSFDISVAPGGESFCRCYACNVNGPLINLLWLIKSLVSRPNSKLFKELAMFLARHNLREEPVEDTPQPKQLRKRLELNSRYEDVPVACAEEEQAVFMEDLGEGTLNWFKDIPDEITKYLKGPKRRLSSKTISKWEIGWQPYAQRITIPIRDQNGRLVGISGRAFRKGDKPKYLHGPEDKFKKNQLLYGLHLASTKEHAFLVEGFFHVIWLWQNAYYNALASMGPYVSPTQVELIKSRFNSITLIPDLKTEKATKANFDRLRSRKIKVKVADVSLMIHPVWVDKDKDPDISDQPPKKLIEILGLPNIS